MTKERLELERSEYSKINLPLPIPLRKNSLIYKENLIRNIDFDPDSPPERIRSRTRVDSGMSRDRKQLLTLGVKTFMISILESEK